MAKSGPAIGKVLCLIAGIDPAKVRKITISASYDADAEVEVVSLIRGADGRIALKDGKLDELRQRFKLHEVKDG